jgi:putative tryptophan/tyrosine transport system substrate-binding protein
MSSQYLARPLLKQPNMRPSPFPSWSFRSATRLPPGSLPISRTRGGNITGNTILGPDIVTKRLQVLRDTIPSAARLAFLWNPNNVSNAALLDELWRTTPFFGMSLRPLEARTAADFPAVFAEMLANRPDAVLTTNDTLHQMHMAEVIDFLLKNRIPGLFQLRRNVVEGGLMSYGTSSSDLFRRGARYVDKILHGANPGDLPIEQPVSFGLVVNMKNRPRHWAGNPGFAACTRR